MAGLTREQRAAKAAAIEAVQPFPQEPFPHEDVQAEGTAGNALMAMMAPAEPLTDPEHGDLTPEWARWFITCNGVAAAAEKYAGREHLLPAKVAALIGGVK